VRSLPNIVLVHGAFADGSDPGETIDVRYSAFTSLQRAGPARSASRYFASCRRTGCSAAPPEASCRFGASNKCAIS